MAADKARTVLVIDDASLVRLYYRTGFEAAGFRVLQALNGLEALETLFATPVDLLVVDVNMPQMDGLTFLRTLRAKDSPVSSIPALVVSSECEARDMAAARAAGANFYLVKPLDHETLLAYASLLCGCGDE